jgi:hypothetical protein
LVLVQLFANRFIINDLYPTMCINITRNILFTMANTTTKRKNNDSK